MSCWANPSDDGVMDISAYADRLRIEDIPWCRLVSTYGRAEDFPALIGRVLRGNSEEAMEALKILSGQIEHQNTLWPCTPFALTFLARKLKAICGQPEDEQDIRTACGIADALTHVAQVCEWAFNMEHAGPLPEFADMLNQANLPPEDSQNLVDFSDELFFSFYFYSFKIIKEAAQLCGKPANDALRSAIAELNEILSRCAETN